MMKPRLLILDYDGSFTDIDAENEPLRTGYLRDIAKYTMHEGKPEFAQLVADAEAAIARAPEIYGWVNDGKIVASATADPRVHLRVTAEYILRNHLADETDIDVILEGLFRKHSQNLPSVFKPDALATFCNLRREGLEVYVVTNSETRSVQKKLQQLRPYLPDNVLDWLCQRVCGLAEKYALDSRFTSVDETLVMPGLCRPVYLRRAKYAMLLDELRRRHACKWSEMLVVGDIFELDLALPFALGTDIALFLHSRVPEYELRFIEEHYPRARLLDGPINILALL